MHWIDNGIYGVSGNYERNFSLLMNFFIKNINIFFRCMVCGQVLSGEYMGKDGQPYCEKGIALGNCKIMHKKLS